MDGRFLHATHRIALTCSACLIGDHANHTQRMIRPHSRFWRQIAVQVGLLMVNSAHIQVDTQNISTCFWTRSARFSANC
jgi:hypothetical protein